MVLWQKHKIKRDDVRSNNKRKKTPGSTARKLFRYNGREIDAKRIDRFIRIRFRDRILTEMELTQRKMTDSFDILQMSC